MHWQAPSWERLEHVMLAQKSVSSSDIIIAMSQCHGCSRARSCCRCPEVSDPDFLVFFHIMMMVVVDVPGLAAPSLFFVFHIRSLNFKCSAVMLVIILFPYLTFTLCCHFLILQSHSILSQRCIDKLLHGSCCGNVMLVCDTFSRLNDSSWTRVRLWDA